MVPSVIMLRPLALVPVVASLLGVAGCGRATEPAVPPVQVASVPAALPEQPDARLPSAQALTVQGNDAAAASLLVQLTKGTPAQADPWLLLAELLMAHDQYASAAQLLHVASCRVRSTQRWQVTLMGARMLMQLGRLDRAKAVLDRLDREQDDQVSGVALGSQPQWKLRLWTSAWVHALGRYDAITAQLARAYVARGCERETGTVDGLLRHEVTDRGPQCQEMRDLYECLAREQCTPLHLRTIDPHQEVSLQFARPCEQSTLPTIEIENLAAPVEGMWSLRDVIRRWRITALRPSVRAGPIVVDVEVRQVTPIRGEGPSVSDATGIEIAAGPPSLVVMPVLSAAQAPALGRLQEADWVRLTGTVRFGHHRGGALVASADTGVFVPAKVEPIAAPAGGR